MRNEEFGAASTVGAKGLTDQLSQQPSGTFLRRAAYVPVGAASPTWTMSTRDLESPSDSTVAAFAGLVVAEATKWFASKAPDLWGKLSQGDRDALIVDCHNLGHKKLAMKYREEMERDGKYIPEPGDSGRRHRANAASIR